ncbi:MAG: hypothetical protein IT316_06350 [Anaerolineales bacterium]|nr:hypothetical protein [Anaerolineales bacterium]
MNNRPVSVSATFILILLNLVFWLVFAVIIAANAHPALPNSPLVKGAMVVLALAAAGALLALLILLGKRSRAAYFMTIGLLGAISLLTILDDFGLADLAVLALNVLPILLLVKDRAWYLQARPEAFSSP